ncbi:hypothetical protein JDF658_27290, partial [Carboxydocella sp. JDF658]
DRIYLNRLSPLGIWSGWSEVPGGGLTLAEPEAVGFRSELNLFVRGTDNGIYQNILRRDLWSGWSEVP